MARVLCLNVKIDNLPVFFLIRTMISILLLFLYLLNTKLYILKRQVNIKGSLKDLTETELPPNQTCTPCKKINQIVIIDQFINHMVLVYWLITLVILFSHWSHGSFLFFFEGIVTWNLIREVISSSRCQYKKAAEGTRISCSLRTSFVVFWEKEPQPHLSNGIILETSPEVFDYFTDFPLSLKNFTNLF